MRDGVPAKKEHGSGRVFFVWSRHALVPETKQQNRRS
ncbi:MAG: hypothetical protein QOG51_739 [Verrucomicrobiota bacterium]|jgi:hypothetical protein